MSARRLFVAAAFLSVSLAAAENSRPKIGVALGGGGARGCAHVGVLRVLERLNIPIDYIAGTSMGAVVAGLYASGMTPDEIDRALTTIDWRDAMTDRTRFKDLRFRRKDDEQRYLTDFEAGLRGGHIIFPRGLRSAQKLRFLLQTYLIPVAGVRDFDKLPTPFRAVAADIENGQAVVLDHGDIGAAIRASMSIPGVFSPSEYEGKLLVDGGIADNIPVDVVRAMGADIVIAVDVSSPLLTREQIGSLFSVTSQVLTILTRQNAQKQIADANVVITPPLSAFGTMQFADASKIIAVGEKDAERQRAKLEPYAVSPELYAELRAARPRPDARNRSIDYLGVEGSRSVDQRVIRARMLTRPGKPLDAERLRHDVTRLYGLDDFEQVTFALSDEGGQHGLLLTLKDKSWGPTYLRASIHLEDDLQGDSLYTVTLSATKTRINALGAEWRNDIRFGAEQGYITEFYQPLDFRGRFFVAPGAELLRLKSPQWEDSRKVAEYGVRVNAGWVDLGLAMGEWGEVRTGVIRGRAHISLATGTTRLFTDKINLAGFRSSVAVIRTDNPTIPHDGVNFGAEAFFGRKALGGDAEYSKVQAQGAVFKSFGRQTLFVAGAAGSSLNTQLPGYDEFSMGGLLALGGFAPGQLHGQRFAIAQLGTYNRVRELSSELGEAVYAGAVFEAGNTFPNDVRVKVSDLHRSVTLLLGAQTVIGPVILGYGRAETGDDRFYIAIGKTF